MGGLTMENLPDEASGLTRKLAIIVNGHVLSAPAIRGAIRDRAEITGDFTEEEVQELADALNASTLPVRLTRVAGP
jgi:preprotein translocase subunit SecD